MEAVRANEVQQRTLEEQQPVKEEEQQQIQLLFIIYFNY